MEEDNISVFLCIIIIASAILRIRQDRRWPRVLARSRICRRARYGAHHSLIKELSSEDPKGFKNFIRMDTNDFEDEGEACSCWIVPQHDKTSKMSVRPAKTQISLVIRPVWSESSLSAWRKFGSLATHWAHSEDWSDWADAQIILLVLSCGSSNTEAVSCNCWQETCYYIAILDHTFDKTRCYEWKMCNFAPVFLGKTLTSATYKLVGWNGMT